MTPSQIQHLIDNEDDFIYNKRYNYSLAELLKKYPEGAPDKIIAACLLISEEEVETIYNNIVLKLRTAMKVEL